MKALLKIFIMTLVVISAPAFAYAGQQEVELTTYYPAPHGDYKDLQTETLESTKGANLATSSGNVGIGTSSPNQNFKLDVSGGVKVSRGPVKPQGGLVLPQGSQTSEDGEIWVV